MLGGPGPRFIAGNDVHSAAKDFSYYFPYPNIHTPVLDFRCVIELQIANKWFILLKIWSEILSTNKRRQIKRDI